MMGVFVQVNETHVKGRWVGHLIGYIIQENGCWDWVGKTTKEGYGCRWIDGREQWAHRAAYENIKGAIPNGLTIDHLCRNRKCVNPAHLEAVTIGVNVKRGSNPWVTNGRKTHCKNGHPFSEDNTYRPQTNRRWPGRQCRKCKNERQNKHRATTGRAKEIVRQRERRGKIASSPHQ